MSTRFLIIYKSKEDKNIRRTYFAPPTIKENGVVIEVNKEVIEAYILKYRSPYEDVTYVELNEELAEIIDFLSENRQRSINAHLETLRDIASSVSEIDDFLCSEIKKMKEDFAEQIKKEKKEED